MSEPSADHVIHIDAKLAQLSPIPSECCIFRVHDRLRNENQNAYEPEVVAIGPYHHGKKKLQPMEEYKLRILRQLLEQRNETSAERYIVAMQQLEKRARDFYAEPSSLDSNEFVEMMLLDSCFILVLLCTEGMTQLGDSNIITLSLEYFDAITPGNLPELPYENPKEDDIKHLLGLLHYCWCYEFHSTLSQRLVVVTDKSMKSATELREAGIQFKKVIINRNLFDIRFVNGTMEIPNLIVDDTTEFVFRNLIAYEQYLPPSSMNYFTAYANFMDNLVNTSNDVQILRDYGVIRNLLGDNEVVSTMLNKLVNNVYVSLICYEQVYHDVNKHCKGRCNVWLATLRQDYFNTPWALISFLAAVVLLLLTVVQTVCSVLSVTKS
ncbi:putative UPF0481 protein At3g02645 isoform X2 [Camellia sinensis]|uniref:putative UPF0481 protein At3g02645 isoform X2 n=1 Tax=Camellia sinensis TaxID=4442 RepID=UPI0010355F47|nr:putative UPF0481 protein At3g02645 isoform X2 [Camellia sinensis]